jgi:hypothetical protein
MPCEFCQRHVDTTLAHLHYSVGLGFTHIEGGADPHLCTRCIRTAFWVYVPINLTLGWLSIDGFKKNAEMLRDNVRAYGASTRMSDGRPSQRPPAPAEPATLSQHVA